MSKRRHKANYPALSAIAPTSFPAKTVTRDTPLLRQAREFWSQRRWDDALTAFEQAVTGEPNNVRALVDAARAFGVRYQFDRADALLQRLLSLDGRNPTTLAHVGESYRLISRYPQAVKCFERACELTKNDAATQLELAALYERLHRLDQAR